MNLTLEQMQAIHRMYPAVGTIRGTVAYDNDGNEFAYDIEAVNAKIMSDAQKTESAKESAVAKLSAIGLTADEIKALIG